MTSPTRPLLIDEAEKRRFIRGRMSSLLIVWLFWGVIIGLVLWDLTGVFAVFVAAVLLCPVLLNSYFSRQQIQRLNEAYARMHERATTLLEEADYFYVTLYTALAVRVRDRAIAVVTADDHFRQKAPRYLNADLVEQASSIHPGADTRVFIGGRPRTGDRMALRNHNDRAEANQYRNTGLRLKVDDLKHPELFCHLEADDIASCGKLLARLKTGDLEPQTPALFFPRDWPEFSTDP